ncbi:MAG: Fe-S cluster assembly ATPase SufC [Ruminococcus sp.]|nr:Fe-S cluster assembly ATPase SufC [Ruminococcus sp.]
MASLLKVEDLNVTVGQTELLHGIDLLIDQNETHVLMGPNGAGKSTLGSAIMGSPEYTVTNGRILFNGDDITHQTADKRAKKGIFLSFQTPVEIPGITMTEFLRNACEQVSGKRMKLWDFRKKLKATMQLLEMDEEYAERELNVGFSGGEKKKAEILQLLMLSPRLAILDETDSGLDVDAVRTVSKGIEEFRRTTGGSLLVITHNVKILDSLSVDKTHILVSGSIAENGGSELVADVLQNGFERFINKES